MWILFSPSEKKCLHHAKEVSSCTLDSLICKDLQITLEAYANFLRTAQESQILKLFGTKSLNLEELTLAQNLLNAPCLMAILRYVGVAFNALNYESLSDSAKAYLQEHLLIFSNLFGVLRPQDKIPYYDLKQGEGFSVENFCFNTKQFYYANASKIWEYFTQNSTKNLEFLDLRAGFYQKCFTLFPKIPHLQKRTITICTPSFIKEGKTLSHYAKFYRGILLQTCAKNTILDLESLLSTEIPNLILMDKSYANSENCTQIHLTFAIKES